MRKILPTAVVSLALGFATASWIMFPERTDELADDDDRVSTDMSFDPALPVEDRIAALERAVSDERFARQLLQEEVFYLTSELERITDDNDFGQTAESDAEQSERASNDSSAARREERRRRNSIEGRMERLIEAGFLPSQASMIVRRESELQMESIKARYEAERSGDMTEYWRSRNSSSQALREELGDADYERYLVANNRSTSVTVSSVFESSPAQSAGLQAGDEIVRYNGKRVFSMTDLTGETMNGAAGQNVVVDILRNGTPMQVVLPRGPIGISGGRRRR